MNETNFIAINYIDCQAHYIERFEELFATRAGAIDRLPGFIRMEVLRPQKQGESYLIVSHWTDESAFTDWTQSAEFIEGHKRGFEDLAKAKAEGKPAPMKSSFKTYSLLCR